MTERRGPLLLDLHDAVPDPPDGLLPWGSLQRQLRRRRAMRSAGAIGGCVVLTAGIVVGVVVGLGSHATRTSVGEHGASNGPLIFEQYEDNGPRVTTDLVRANPDGSDLRVIARGFAAEDDAAVTPDGREVAYVAESDTPLSGGGLQAHYAIHLVGTGGSGDRLAYRCPTMCSDLSWSPNGSDLVFTANGIEVMDSAGHVHSLCGQHCVQAAAEPAWSPDGKQIAFSQAASTGYTGVVLYSSAIYVIGSNGTDLRKLTDRTCPFAGKGTDCSFDRAPAWSPDGRQIAFYRTVYPQRPGGNSPAPTQGVLVMNANGSQVTPVWTCAHCQPTAPQWSPDGTKIAFAASNHRSRAYIVDVSRATPLTTAIIAARSRPGVYEQVRWSPDGTQLALGLFHGRGRGLLEVSFGAIETVNADGSGLTRLRLPRVNGDPMILAWTPASPGSPARAQVPNSVANIRGGRVGVVYDTEVAAAGCGVCDAMARARLTPTAA
jgi:Tol biopolymer transport system component